MWTNRLFSELAQVIPQVLRDTPGPLQRDTRVSFLTDTRHVHRCYLHEPDSTQYRYLTGEY